jgi:hypothetical protein
MRDVARLGLLRWVHMGDLHMTTDQESNYRDLLEVIDRINTCRPSPRSARCPGGHHWVDSSVPWQLSLAYRSWERWVPERSLDSPSSPIFSCP